MIDPPMARQEQDVILRDQNVSKREARGSGVFGPCWPCVGGVQGGTHLGCCGFQGRVRPAGSEGQSRAPAATLGAAALRCPGWAQLLPGPSPCARLPPLLSLSHTFVHRGAW